MPAEEFYRPIRYNLYQQDPSAQTLDLLASGGREQIRQAENIGQQKARAEEAKWNKLEAMPERFLEQHREGKREGREAQRFAEEQALRDLQMGNTRQEMENRQKDITMLDTPDATGKSLRQKRAEFEGGAQERYLAEETRANRGMDIQEKQVRAALAAQGLTARQIEFEIAQAKKAEKEAGANRELEALYAGAPGAQVDPAQLEAQAAEIEKRYGLGGGYASAAQRRVASSKGQAAAAQRVFMENTQPWKDMKRAYDQTEGDLAVLEDLNANRAVYASGPNGALRADNEAQAQARQNFGAGLQRIGYSDDVTGTMPSLRALNPLSSEEATFDPSKRMAGALTSLTNQKLQEWNQKKAGMTPEMLATPEVQGHDKRFQALQASMKSTPGAGGGSRNSFNMFLDQQGPIMPASNSQFMAPQQQQQSRGRGLINYGSGPGVIPPQAPQEDPALTRLKRSGVLVPTSGGR